MSAKFPLGSNATTRTSVLPSDVATWGLTKVLIQDSMKDPSTFDLANTLDTSKTWFIKNTWASCADTWAQDMIPTPLDYLRIDHNGTALLQSVSDVGDNNSFASAADNGSGGYVGTPIKLPFYVEFEYLVDPSQASGPLVGTYVIGIWLMSLPYLTNTISGSVFAEKDFLEMEDVSGPILTPSSHTHQWTAVSGMAGTANTATNYAIATPSASNKWHKLAVMMIPSTLNSGVGIHKLWSNGVHLSANDISWGPSQNVSPGVDGINSNGLFDIYDTESFAFAFGTSDNMFLAVRNILVLGAP